jgi:hypothetical protein
MRHALKASSALVAVLGLAGVAGADIAYIGQTDEARVQGFVFTPGFPLGQYNDFLSGNTLLAPVSYAMSNSASSGLGAVASDMSAAMNSTTFGVDGLRVTGSVSGHASSLSEGATNTTPGSFQDFDLSFTIDAPTQVFLEVRISEATAAAAGSIGLSSNPNSVGWGAGPGLYTFNDVLAPGQYNLNVNTGVFYSTGGTTEAHAAVMSFVFELGVVPAPSAALAMMAGGMCLTRRRR